MIYLGNGMYSDAGPSLSHHGIKGQRWGVRNGPPYPLEDKVYSGDKPKLSKEDKKRAKLKKRQERDQRNKHNKNNVKDHLERSATIVSATLGLNPFAIASIAGDVSASANINLYLHNREKKSSVDKKTGLYLKDKEYTKEQDVKKINPTKTSMSTGSHNNCMLCTTAYDLRRRGFDVIANYAQTGYNTTDVKKWYPKSKIDHCITFVNGQTKGMSLKQKIETMKAERKRYNDKINKAISDISKQEGSHGNFMVQWSMYAGGPRTGGHSMAYDVVGGKVRVMDCQTGKIYKDITKSKFINPDKCNDLTFIRLDNCTPDYNAIKKDGVIL